MSLEAKASRHRVRFPCAGADHGARIVRVDDVRLRDEALVVARRVEQHRSQHHTILESHVNQIGVVCDELEWAKAYAAIEGAPHRDGGPRAIAAAPCCGAAAVFYEGDDCAAGGHGQNDGDAKKARSGEWCVAALGE
eukprot:4494011-Prymnesium_polylepis.1